MNARRYILFLILIPTLLQAQDTTLEPFSSIIGNPAEGETQDWIFTAVDGEVVSLIAEGTGNFDPVLTVLSETGAVLLENDDFDYPTSSNAVLQAITIPFTGTYTARVSGFNGMGGTYNLSRLRGFAEGAKLNGFSSTDSWESANEDLSINIASNTLTLELTGSDVSALAVDNSTSRLTDYFAQVTVNITDGDPGWIIHMTARQQSNTSYYLFSLNNQGFWRFSLWENGVETLIRDWVSHPAITAGEVTFDLGILANGVGFDLYYNGSPLGYFVDETLSDGIIGLGIETLPALESVVEVEFTDLVVTVPMFTTSGETPPLSRIILQDPIVTARSLEHRQQIPTGGDLAMNVPQSTVQSGTPGVSRIALGRGSTFTNFVLASDVTIQAGGNTPAGCGIYMRATDDTHYALAYIDQTGAYGLSERQGEVFLIGVYGEQPDLGEDTHQLLVIAHEKTIRFFIDGNYVGEIEASVTEGEIGNAAVNFEPNVTSCLFENTWLWEW